MKKIVTLTVLLVLAIAASADTAEILRTETTKNLKENLLPFWMEKTVDPQGGFYGVVLNAVFWSKLVSFSFCFGVCLMFPFAIFVSELKI